MTTTITQTYTTPGTTVFTLAGKSNIRFEMWGAGGNGAAGNGVSGGGGGGSGAYSYGIYAASGEGETFLNLTVGTPTLDCALVSGDGNDPGLGMNTEGGSHAVGATHGTGGSGNGGDEYGWITVFHNGGNGTDGVVSGRGGGGAGGAGSTGNGTNASAATGGGATATGGGSGGNGGASGSIAGTAGSLQGGGGGGGAFDSGAAGAGTNGKVIMTWDIAPAALPTPTLLTRNLTSLAQFDGKFLFNESISDSLNEAVDNPVTWKNQSPQNTIDFSFFTVAVDTTDVSMVALPRGNGSGAVKISVNCALVAQHVPGNGDAYYFMKANGTEVVKARSDFIPIANDLAVIVFASSIADADIPPIALPTAAAYNSIVANGECLAIEMDRHLNRLTLSASNSSATTDTTIAADDADIIEGGDSGKPCFALNGTRPILMMSAFETATTGPNPTHYLQEINDIVVANGGNITLVDFQSGDGGGMAAIRGAIRGCINNLHEEDEE